MLLIPFFGWGLYLLRLQLRFHEEPSQTVELATALGLVFFYAVEFALLKRWETASVPYFVFAILGLVVSGAALYGPMIISATARLIVDTMMPSDQTTVREPRYGPAEALERRGDYEGAVQEYMVIARIFPRDPTAAVRIGDNLMKLGRPEEAAPWFERGLKNLTAANRCLSVTNRLCDIYLRQLERREDAQRVLKNFLERFPESEYAPFVRERLNSLPELAPTAAPARIHLQP